MKAVFALFLAVVIVAVVSAVELDPVEADKDVSPITDAAVQPKAKIQKRGLYGFGLGYGWGWGGYPGFYGGWGYGGLGWGGWGWGFGGYGYGYPWY